MVLGIKEKITLDPFALHFALKGRFKCYGHLKGGTIDCSFGHLKRKGERFKYFLG
jgi:hypothetical protein